MQIDYGQSRKYQAKVVVILFVIVEAIFIGLYLSKALDSGRLGVLIKGSTGIALIPAILIMTLGFYRKIKFTEDEIVIEKAFWGKVYRIRRLKYTDMEYFYDFTKSYKVINKYFRFKLAKFPYGITLLVSSTLEKGYGRFVSPGKLKQFLISKGVKYLSKKEREMLWD